MKKYDDCLIYFDTNAFEDHTLGKYLPLYEIRASRLYYDICSMIDELGLTNRVELCIPEIVWREVKHHLYNHFKTVTTNLSTAITESKKFLGDLLDVGYELKEIIQHEDYEQYIEQIATEFLDNVKNRARIVDCPKDKEFFCDIIEGVIVGRSPFRSVKQGKTNTDAGFKDVLIWETIKRSDSDKLILFVTNDNDFKDIDCSNIFICPKSADVKKLLIENMNITADIWFNGMLRSNNSYLLQQVLAVSGLSSSQSVSIDSVISSEFGEDEETSKSITCVCNIIIDNLTYRFTIVYDTNANELVSVDYDEYME